MTTPHPKVYPAMRGRYLIRNPLSAAVVAAVDTVLRLVPRRRFGDIPVSPNRILVANWAHLGDAVTSLGAIKWLRQTYPKARIGMIVSSWNKIVVQDSADIDDIYVIDHWRLNRSTVTIGQKKQRYAEMRRSAVAAIRDAQYQIGIDFYPFFPQAHPIFYQVEIPVRIGFSSGGLWPLLTHPVPWHDADRPVSDFNRDLLNCLSPKPLLAFGDLRPRLPIDKYAILPQGLQGGGGYVVLHPGAGAAFKDWGIANWKALVAMLQRHPSTAGLRIAITGSGEKEKAVAAEIAASGEDIIDLIGNCNWQQFLSVLAHAHIVVCPDTVTAHAAGLFEVPTVCIFTGVNNSFQWGPANPNAVILVGDVPCRPCNTGGCQQMTCIRSVSVAQVFDAILAHQKDRRVSEGWTEK